MWHKPLFVSLVLAVTPLTLTAQGKPAVLDQVLARDRSLTSVDLSRVKANRLGGKDKLRGIPMAAVRRPASAGLPFPVPEHVEMEREINDSIGYADPLDGSVQGALDSSADIDVYEFEVPVDGRFLMTMWPSGPNPVVEDGLLMLITDGRGQGVVFGFGGYNWLIDTPMVAGTYYVQVFSSFGDVGTYQLNAGTAHAPFTAINPGQVMDGSIDNAFGGNGYTLTVPTDSRVNMRITQVDPLDLFSVVLNSRGSVHQIVDDSTSGGLNPAFDSHLPAGVYHFLVLENFGMTGAYTLQVDLTPMAIPSIDPVGTVTGTSFGGESYLLYEVVLPQDQEVHFHSAPGSNNPMPDPGFVLYDRELTQMFFQDDDGSSLYSSLQVPLPAGTYYLACYDVGGGSGTFDVSTTSSPINPTPANLGLNEGNLTPGPGTSLFRMTTRTPDFVEFNTLLTGTMDDSDMAVLDSSGLVIGANDDHPLFKNLSSLVGTLLPPGNSWILVREFGNLGGTFQLDVRSTLYFTDSASKTELNIRGKAGDYLGALVAALSEHVIPFPLQPPLMGNILLDLNPFVVLGSKQIPMSGRTTWPGNFSLFPGVFQGLTVDSLPSITTGRTTLVVR